MKKIRIGLIMLLAVSLLSVQAQKKKTGLKFGALPAIAYDSDLGFEYGGLINLYQYGDGSKYPKYNHSLYMEWSRYTKGTGINRIMYDSDELLKGIRTTVDMTYLTDQMYHFYGFNGGQSIYDADFSDASRYFYRMERNMFRVKADFQGKIKDTPFGWVGGLTFYNFAIGNVNLNKLGIPEIEGGSLYQRYIDKGLISTDEADGGNLTTLKVGLKYDTRDQLACPMKGIWTEAVLQTALPGLSEASFTKMAIIHRQYFTLTKDMSLAYRLDYQGTLGNSKVPFYAQPLVITSYLTTASSEGIGGKSTLRGILRNRIVGDAMAFGNFEFRYKFLRFGFAGQDFYLGTNIFLDAGSILKPIDISSQLSGMSAADKELLYLNDTETNKIHTSAGAGLKIGWNENFVLSVDYGKAFDSQDGNSGLYIILNWLF